MPNRAFTNLPLLEELWLGRNKLTSLASQDFVSLKQLQVLHLEGCKAVDSLSLQSGALAANTDLRELVIECPHLQISSQVILAFKQTRRNQGLFFKHFCNSLSQ